MKASKAIELALEGYYGFCGDGTSKPEFMCHSLEGMLHKRGYDFTTECAVCEAKGRIGHELAGRNTLVGHLLANDRKYNFKGGDNDTLEAYTYRVNWWKSFIERLKAKDL